MNGFCSITRSEIDRWASNVCFFLFEVNFFLSLADCVGLMSVYVISFTTRPNLQSSEFANAKQNLSLCIDLANPKMVGFGIPVGTLLLNCSQPFVVMRRSFCSKVCRIRMGTCV